jgi:predicted dithiol-disulfide oxidoreductase (DUF899 family)
VSWTHSTQTGRIKNMTAAQTIVAIVSNLEWLQARRALLEEEKASRDNTTNSNRRRWGLPWLKGEKD